MNAKSLWVVEEKEPYWPEWIPKFMYPSPAQAEHVAETCRRAPCTPTVEFRVTEYRRVEVTHGQVGAIAV